MLDLPATEDDGSIWVFGYGSLMWRPGFEALERSSARLAGYQRRFCIYSVHHRGSAERPGLVLGLDRGGSCDGVAFRVAAGEREDTLAYLRAREQVNGVYREAHVGLELVGHAGRHVIATTFIAEPAHPSYAGKLPIAMQARLIRAAAGLSGANIDYLFQTIRQLETMQIHDRDLYRVMSTIGPHLRDYASHRSDHFGGRMGGVRLACQRFAVAAPRMRPDQRRRFNHRIQIAGWRMQSR